MEFAHTGIWVKIHDFAHIGWIWQQLCLIFVPFFEAFLLDSLFLTTQVLPRIVVGVFACCMVDHFNAKFWCHAFPFF
jgi:hypothetical protein